MDEKQLIKKIKKKDEKALIIFIDTYGKIIKGAIKPILSYKKELIGEVLDDSFLAIWENIESFDPSRSSFKNWCAGVAKYKAIDALRKEIRHKAISTDAISEIPCEDYINLGQIDEILEILDYEDQILLKKLFIEGFSYDDISKQTGIKKPILYNKVSRAKKLIRLNKKE